MKAKQLIKLLQSCDPESEVFIMDTESETVISAAEFGEDCGYLHHKTNPQVVICGSACHWPDGVMALGIPFEQKDYHDVMHQFGFDLKEIAE